MLAEIDRLPDESAVETATPHVVIRNASRNFVQKISAVEVLLSRVGMNYADRVVQAVSDVSLEIPRGTALGLVGESGCGKSTLGRMAAGLLSATHGEVIIDGERMDAGHAGMSARDMLRVQMVFQNPMASLNPRQKVVDIVTEAAVYHGLIRKRDRQEFAAELLREVGLPPDVLNRLPHQFSGGQRQRIGIARALSVSPEFLICDEPVAALDVLIQAQIINLLLELKERRKLTLLFISHDLGVVRHICDEVVVMYLGRIVERASTADLFAGPAHPYTQALFREIPRIGSGRRSYEPISGEIPSPLSPPTGCHFHPRCPCAIEKCSLETPTLIPVGNGRVARCWLPSV